MIDSSPPLHLFVNPSLYLVLSQSERQIHQCTILLLWRSAPLRTDESVGAKPTGRRRYVDRGSALLRTDGSVGATPTGIGATPPLRSD
jgi:hypothetical protein